MIYLNSFFFNIDDRRMYRDNRDSYQRDRDYKDGRNQGRSRDNKQDVK